MAFRDSWHSALVYFGLAEEYHDDYDGRARAPGDGNRGSLPRAARTSAGCAAAATSIDDIFAEEDAEEARPRGRAARRYGRAQAGCRRGNGDVRVHLVVPKSFNDAQQIADKFKDSIPVILNLQGSETDLSKRLIDFASGLTYALDGGMQRIADKVFMLTPRNVEISAEERARLIEKGFFNQS